MDNSKGQGEDMEQDQQLTKDNWNVIVKATCNTLLDDSMEIPNPIVNNTNNNKMKFLMMDFL